MRWVPTTRSVAQSLSNLAAVYYSQSRYAEAEPLVKRSLAISEKAQGPDHPEVAVKLNNLAEIYRAQGAYAEAEPLSKRALAIREKALGPDHPDTGLSLHNLAGLYFAQRDWKTAASYWSRSTEVLIRRSLRGTETVGAVLTGKARSDVERENFRFRALVKATHRVAETDAAGRPQLARDMFKTAQWAHGSEAAASLAQMAARQAKGDGALARLVRERQDLAGEWQTRDKALIAARSGLPGQRNAARRSRARCPPGRHRCTHRRHRPHAGQGLSRVRVSRQSRAARHRRSPGPAWQRRSPAAFSRHTRNPRRRRKKASSGSSPRPRRAGCAASSAPRRWPSGSRPCAAGSIEPHGTAMAPAAAAPCWGQATRPRTRKPANRCPSILPARMSFTGRCSARCKTSSRASTCWWCRRER